MGHGSLTKGKEIVILDDDDDDDHDNDIAVDMPKGKNFWAIFNPSPHHFDSTVSSQIDQRNGPPALSDHRSPLPNQNSDAIPSGEYPRSNRAAYFTSASWRFPESVHDLPHTNPSSSSKSSRDTRSPAIFGGSPGHNAGRSLSIKHGSILDSIDASGRPTLTAPSSPNNAPTILLSPPPTESIEDEGDEDDFMDEDEFNIWMTRQHEEETRSLSITPEVKAKPRRKSSNLIPRNPSIVYPYESLKDCTYNGIRLTPRSFVELQDEDFMKIVHVVRDNSTLEVTIRGYIFRRTKEMNGLVDRKMNEVCWILHVDDDDPREPLVQGVETRAISEVVRRRMVRLTNRPFPDLSFRGEDKATEETVANHRDLVCRYKYLCFYANAKARKAYRWCEKGLHRIREDECDRRADNDMKDTDLRYAWRGTTIPGGAKEGWLPGEKEFLRQEAISHRGITSWQSLKAPSGPDFHPGDPMERGTVGSILYASDLSQDVDACAANPRQREESSISILENNETADWCKAEDTVSPASSSGYQDCETKPLRSQFSVFDAFGSGSNDHDLDEVHELFGISRGSRRNSIAVRRARKTSPQVVEIDAKVKTSSSLGTYKKHYEGTITSTYIPKPLLKRKRLVDDSIDLTPRSLKKSRGHLSESCRDSPWYSDRSYQNDRAHHSSVSQDAWLDDSLKDSYPFTGTHKSRLSGLLKPHSVENSEVLNTPAHAERQEWRARAGRNQSTVVDFDGVIDLTAPHANTDLHFKDKSRHSTPLPKPSFSDKPGSVNRRAPVLPSPRISTDRNLGSSLFSAPEFRPSSFRSRSPLFHTAPNGRYRGTPISSRIKADSSSPASAPSGPQSRIKPEHNVSSKVKQRRYTFGDGFCGAGGMSRGAINAGLRISWGFDFNLRACETYAKNFFGTPVYKVWAHEFADSSGDHKVDICHLSTPCQFFSDAHTVQGKDDDMNTASLFSIFNLLQKAKPRVVTFEQTSGLIRRHPIFFNAVINMFTSRGFSVRWRVMNCADFGLPQRRMRLFIIASCPGEPLPPFPKPTHTSQPNHPTLLPWTTINHALAPIPSTWPNHSPHLARPRSSPPQTGDRIATCITTNGGPGNIHPSGTRDYTHREYACLQSFPLGHRFGEREVKRQIGNAVPPVVATVLLEEVRRGLLRVDGVEG